MQKQSDKTNHKRKGTNAKAFVPQRTLHLFWFPITFGGADVSGRIKHAISFQKPKKYLTAFCILLCIMLTACFSTNRKTSEDKKPDAPSNFSGTEELTHALTPTPAPTENIPMPAIGLSDDKGAVQLPSTLPAAYLKTQMDNEWYELLHYDELTNLHPPQKKLTYQFTINAGMVIKGLGRDLTYTGPRKGSELIPYLISEFGVETNPNNPNIYSLTFSAQDDIYAKNPENGNYLLISTCVSETPKLRLEVYWINEYIKGYGWDMTTTSITLVPKSDDVTFDDTAPIVTSRDAINGVPLFRAYIGYLDEFPEEWISNRFPKTDIDGDGAPDRVYRTFSFGGGIGYTYQLHFSSGEILPLVYGANYAYGGVDAETPGLQLCDLTGDGRSDLLFSLVGLGTAGEYGFFYAFTQDADEQWQKMPEIPALQLRVTPLSEKEYTLTAPDGTVFGPYQIPESVNFSEEMTVENYFPKLENDYFLLVAPDSVALSETKLTDNPKQTVLSLSGFWDYSKWDPFLTAGWELSFQDGEWKLLSMELKTR